MAPIRIMHRSGNRGKAEVVPLTFMPNDSLGDFVLPIPTNSGLFMITGPSPQRGTEDIARVPLNCEVQMLPGHFGFLPSARKVQRNLGCQLCLSLTRCPDMSPFLFQTVP